jgi:hypothetical protein
MSDKKMLNEATIRKMMKLANIPALSDKFIQENYYTYNEQEEEVGLEDEFAPDAPVDDIGIDAEAEVEEPDLGVEVAEELVKDLMGVIEDHFPEVDINVDGANGEEEEVEMDAELDLEEPMPEEPPVDLGGEEELGIDAEVEEEEPILEDEIEEDTGVYADPDEKGGPAFAEVEADKAFMEEEVLDEEGDSAHSKLIDAIAAKVAERLLAEAKKTNK